MIQFDFNEHYILENEVLRLSPLTLNDYEHLVHFSIHEPELWTYSLMQANSPQNLKLYLENAVAAREKQTAYAFSVYDKVKEKYAGSTRFYDVQPENSMLQLGFTWYGKEFQGTKLNKNCKYLLLQFAFETIGVHRVEFRADSRNMRSIQAMKSIGCKEEGVLRSNGYTAEGHRRDSIVLSILNDEWIDTVKAELKQKL